MGHPEARAGIWEGFGWARCELMLGWPHLPAWLAPTNQTFRILKLPRSVRFSMAGKDGSM